MRIQGGIVLREPFNLVLPTEHQTRSQICNINCLNLFGVVITESREGNFTSSSEYSSIHHLLERRHLISPIVTLSDEM